MTQATQQALDIIKMIADRAIQRGNMFSGVIEVSNFISAYNHIMAALGEQEKAEHNGLPVHNQQLTAK